MGTDKTAEIARHAKAQVVVKSNQNKSNWIKVQENINWAIDNAKTDWILRIDADEEVTPELKKEIEQILEKPGTKVAYGIPRNQFFFGGFLKGGDWAHDRLVRLFRPQFARYTSPVHIHEQFTVTGETDFLTGKLNHYSHPNLTLAMEKFNSYTGTEILDHHESKGKALCNLFIQPPYIFFRWLIWHGGYRDGLRGIIAASYRAWYEFMLWSKYLERLNATNLDKR